MRILLFLCVGWIIVTDGFLQPTRAAEELSRNQIFELQYRLDQLGLDAGKPDGKTGARTLAALAAFAKRIGSVAELTSAMLQKAGKAAAGIEGLVDENGQIDLLVFTDQGTAQIVRVENWGQIHKSNSRVYVRDYDLDGRPLYAEYFEVSGMDRVGDIQLVPWASFGYKMHFPTPPKEERLDFEQTIVRPQIGNDGTVTTATTVDHNILLKAPPAGPWYWYTGIEKEADPRLQGTWTMQLGQKGKVFMSRAFEVRQP
jgi:peptidoglycan hydrolase-like protein with peptidoglycan-binding domain